MLPAFAHIGAPRAFAHRVQIECAHNGVQLVEILSAAESHLQPGWPLVRVRRRRRVVRQYVEGSRHQELKVILRADRRKDNPEGFGGSAGDSPRPVRASLSTVDHGRTR